MRRRIETGTEKERECVCVCRRLLEFRVKERQTDRERNYEALIRIEEGYASVKCMSVGDSEGESACVGCSGSEQWLGESEFVQVHVDERKRKREREREKE